MEFCQSKEVGTLEEKAYEILFSLFYIVRWCYVSNVFSGIRMPICSDMLAAQLQVGVNYSSSGICTR